MFAAMVAYKCALSSLAKLEERTEPRLAARNQRGADEVICMELMPSGLGTLVSGGAAQLLMAASDTARPKSNLGQTWERWDHSTIQEHPLRHGAS